MQPIRKNVLQNLVEALDALPIKELIQGEIYKPIAGKDCFCALGAMVWHEHQNQIIDMVSVKVDELDDYIDIFPQEWREIYRENDFGAGIDSNAKRWKHMKSWAKKELQK